MNCTANLNYFRVIDDWMGISAESGGIDLGEIPDYMDFDVDVLDALLWDLSFSSMDLVTKQDGRLGVVGTELLEQMIVQNMFRASIGF